jgi:hypothetical protein
LEVACRSKEDATIVGALSYLRLEAAAEVRKTLPLLELSLTSDKRLLQK